MTWKLTGASQLLAWGSYPSNLCPFNCISCWYVKTAWTCYWFCCLLYLPPSTSSSLGCKAIFLLGGKSRQDPPIAMFLRSGDVVLMAGEARECFHGNVTLIITLTLYQDAFLLFIITLDIWIQIISIDSFVEISLTPQHVMSVSCRCTTYLHRWRKWRNFFSWNAFNKSRWFALSGIHKNFKNKHQH